MSEKKNGLGARLGERLRGEAMKGLGAGLGDRLRGAAGKGLGKGVGGRLRRGAKKGAIRVAGAVDSWMGRDGTGNDDALLLVDLVQDLSRAHLSEAARVMADLAPRSIPASQAVARFLPALFRYEDPQLVALYHAIVVAAIAQGREAGPTVAGAIPVALAGLSAAHRRSYLARVLRGVYVDWNLGLVIAETLPKLQSTLTDAALDTFIRHGMTLWEESAEKATSFFRLESRLGQSEASALRNVLRLEGVRRTLQLYAQAHSGLQVKVRSLEELPEHLRRSNGSRAFTDGYNIYLPSESSGYENDEENFRLFKAMTAIEAGRIEFDGFQLTRCPGVQSKTGEEIPPPLDARSLQQEVAALPHPAIANDLFGLLETHRIESRLRHEYPGLVADLERLSREGLASRPPVEALVLLPAIIEACAQRLWGGDTHLVRLPAEAQPYVTQLLEVCLPLALPTATVRDTLLVTRAALMVLQPLLEEDRSEAEEEGRTQEEKAAQIPAEPESEGRGGQESPSSQAGESRRPEVGSRRERLSSTGGYQGLEPLPYQGKVWLEAAAELQEKVAEEAARAHENPDALSLEVSEEGQQEVMGLAPEGGEEPTERMVEALAKADATLSGEMEPEVDAAGPVAAAERENRPRGVKAISLYPEWDWHIEDYKDDWCRVVEEGLPEGSSAFARDTLEDFGPIVGRLKRQFQRIRREEFEKLRRQPEGDELDLEALIAAVVDRKGGHPPSDRVYIRRQKQVRDVAVAFLVDMSSSTQQVVQSSGKTILDIEKESLLLMAEALESLGDAYAIYGFSGYGRQRVSFYVAKEFAERYTTSVRRRIAGMSGRLENRDGAAIRHTTQRLLKQPARVRLLILLSDGRPLDCGCRQYFERYAQEDTRIALREARRQGIHPFCITVDRQAQRYLSQMYHQVQFTIIDQVSALPHRLPNIYRRLTT